MTIRRVVKYKHHIGFKRAQVLVHMQGGKSAFLQEDGNIGDTPFAGDIEDVLARVVVFTSKYGTRVKSVLVQNIGDDDLPAV